MEHKKSNRNSRYDVFISYRRDGGDMTAKIIYDELVKAGYSVFMDVETLKSGRFNVELLDRIDECKDFVLILPPNAIDRCVNDGDWVRIEIEHAISKNKNIVPIELRGFTMPSKDSLPPLMKSLPDYNRIEANNQNFNQAIEKLCLFLKSKKIKKIKSRVILFSVAMVALAIISLVCISLIQKAADAKNTMTISKLAATHTSQSGSQKNQTNTSSDESNEGKDNKLDEIYNEAVEKFNNGKYEEAKVIFSTLGDYKGSKEYIAGCDEEISEKTYQDCLSKFDNGEYEEALAGFELISDYRDSADYVLKCQDVIEKKGKQRKQYSDAIVLFNSGEYVEAKKVFESLGDYENSEEYATKCNNMILEEAYQNYIFLFLNEEYEKALEGFESISDYSDSASYATKCRNEIEKLENLRKRYDEAVKLFNKGEYEEAKVIFVSLGDYENSSEYAVKCDNSILERAYNTYVSLFLEGEYEEALKGFVSLGDFSDSSDYVAKCAKALEEDGYQSAVKLYNDGKYINAKIAFTKLGDEKNSIEYIDKCDEAMSDYQTLFFGKYEQDGNLENGKEDIEWIVLFNEDDCVGLISKYVLDCVPYNSDSQTEWRTTWEISTIRNWLNEQFMKSAFSSEEIALFQSSYVTARGNPRYPYITDAGEDTVDKVFIFDIDELLRFFSDQESRVASATPAVLKEYSEVSSWWLRNRGYNNRDAIIVDFDGSVSYSGCDVREKEVGVRPVVIVDFLNFKNN